MDPRMLPLSLAVGFCLCACVFVYVMDLYPNVFFQGDRSINSLSGSWWGVWRNSSAIYPPVRLSFTIFFILYYLDLDISNRIHCQSFSSNCSPCTGESNRGRWRVGRVTTDSALRRTKVELADVNEICPYLRSMIPLRGPHAGGELCYAMCM